MKKNLTKLMLIALVAIMPLSIFAQKKQTKPVEKYFYISAEGGLSINHTDIANYGGLAFIQDGAFTIDNYLFNNFDGKLGLGYQLGKVIGVNAKFGMGSIAGEKHGQQLVQNGFVANNPTVANKGFEDVMLDKTTFMEGNLNLTFNFTNLFFGYNPRRVFNFIPHIGIGGIRYKAGAVTSTTGATSPNLAAKDAEMTYTVPVGAELNFNVARKLDLFIDYTFTWAGNDKLDQVEKLPDDIQVINDMYSSLNLGLRYKFNKKPCDIETMAANAGQIGMRVNPDQLEEKDGQVCFDVIFTVPAEYFEKEAVMNITPTLTYAGGQVELDPVTFVGEKVDGGDFKVNYKTGGEYTKHYCTDYIPDSGMEKAKLIGNPMFYVYNGNIYGTQEEIMKNAYFTQGGDRVITEGIKYVAPVVIEPVNTDTIIENPEPVVVEPIAVFFFDYESATLKSNTKLNKAAVKAIAEKLASSEGFTGFEIKGWASPENGDGNNNKLSADRANIVVNTIKSQLKKVKLNEKDFTFDATGCGSDWDTFMDLVQNSNIADKDQIIRVINNAGASKKEQEIQNMKKVYPELEKDILPLIRRAEIYLK